MVSTLNILLLWWASCAQSDQAFDLPELLVAESGEVIDTVQEWQSQRRPEVIELFRENVYGCNPIDKPHNLKFEVKEINPEAMSGKATLKLVDISYGGPGGNGCIHLAVFLPNDRPSPAPGFLLICNRPREENIDPTRVTKSPFWPTEEIVDRGYVAATFHIEDVDPDEHDQFKNGVHGIFDPLDSPRGPDAWGSIAAWAWGASRCMDYFEADNDIDHTKMAVVGHSRGGKTALWCGATDERFALVISNESGCTGAALARRKSGEDIQAINNRFPHWFCENYKKYDGKEDELPIDQHMLLALMAPRLVYVSSATEDKWADPLGEFLSCVYAEPVFDLYGVKGLGTSTMPAANSPLHEGQIGYHLRRGSHDLTRYDWNCFMDFADKHWETATRT
ncbi:alpha/beta hydrolase family protein [Bythopirellula polymerisocia]|uniref:4-O-methyl-glucuronoyl methylesterase-like domain-containing protein n=1 Tax=Bythopirellula polymerisocia TaxID=2528003 RepID=A0A5C6CK63_9BACT|nr:acetylxylan esterase [Bythopirellula polymerisocia]TWU23691.1 hypothetical protein Pla144_38660 [Bythopirellula polymerisocia]